MKAKGDGKEARPLLSLETGQSNPRRDTASNSYPGITNTKEDELEKLETNMRSSASCSNLSNLTKTASETKNIREVRFSTEDAKNLNSIAENLESKSATPALKELWVRGQKERWWIAPEEFKLPEKEMASGNCGKVYVTKWRSMKIAVKTIKRTRSRKEVEDLQQEIMTWSSTRHPNIVTFMGASCSPKNGIMLIMEFMAGGDLQGLLDEKKGPLPFKRAYSIALDVGKALCFLHSCHPSILHRDLKPPNILFDSNGVAKLADFGLSKFVNSRLESYRMTAKTGTVRYMAPEVLLGNAYSCNVDVYSFGMILSYMLSGSKPYRGFDVKKRIQYAKAGIEAPLPKLHPKDKELIRKCVVADPHKRISIIEATDELEMIAASRMSSTCCLIS
eukprot:CAMPEP_0114501212 /NCGR_PEP_ID=MMETSP0109-20121206/8377_1 /TAXON_ID=29199 /ORGANISM="Chlorarachnion reptans, Strain CCCM449" /LENGTH=389 /DNA_ID=CAMNT_0001678925 /DNA_START=23 /DNA_END=1192 /DNA_ORIENTATION=-